MPVELLAPLTFMSLGGAGKAFAMPSLLKAGLVGSAGKTAGASSFAGLKGLGAGKGVAAGKGGMFGENVANSGGTTHTVKSAADVVKDPAVKKEAEEFLLPALALFGLTNSGGGLSPSQALAEHRAKAHVNANMRSESSRSSMGSNRCVCLSKRNDRSKLYGRFL